MALTRDAAARGAGPALRIHDRVRDVHQQFRRAADPRPRRRAVHDQPDVRALLGRRELSERRGDRRHHVRRSPRLVVYVMTQLVRGFRPPRPSRDAHATDREHGRGP